MLSIEKKQPTADVTVSDKNGEVVEQIPVGEPVLVTPVMANVGVKVGMTKNLGNYESLRVDVSLYMPCEAEDQAIHDTFDFVQNWCDLKMQGIMEELE